MKKNRQGYLIVFEGIDGGGKTTQAKMLFASLNDCGFDTVYFREPSDSKWGNLIREKAAHADSLTPEEELDLFINDRKENVEHNLKPALAQGKVVVLDRYYFSTIAYQGAKGLDPRDIRKQNEEFAVLPDLVFILDIAADGGLERIKNRKQMDLLFEREDYLVKVREIFKGFQDENIFFINADRSLEKVAEEIQQITFTRIKR